MMKRVIFLITICSALVCGQKRTIVFYGTSLTVTGRRVSNLMARVKQDFPNVAYYNSAKGGMNSKWGKVNLKDRVTSKNPDIVTTGFAVNDCADYPNQYYNDTFVPLDSSEGNAKDNFRTMIVAFVAPRLL